MHDKNLIHRDIKPENMIVQHRANDSDLPEIKVIDFGTSRVLLKNDNTLSQKVGTIGYMAPEVLEKNSYMRWHQEKEKNVREYM